MYSGLFYPYYMDESIYQSTGVCFLSILFLLRRNRQISADPDQTPRCVYVPFMSRWVLMGCMVKKRRFLNMFKGQKDRIEDPMLSQWYNSCQNFS